MQLSYAILLNSKKLENETCQNKINNGRKKKHKNLTPCLIFFYIYAEIEYRQKHKNIRKRFSGDTAFINRCQFSMF